MSTDNNIDLERTALNAENKIKNIESCVETLIESQDMKSTSAKIALIKYMRLALEVYENNCYPIVQRRVKSLLEKVQQHL